MMILPVVREITMVAEVHLFSIMALDEARTVISEGRGSSSERTPSSIECGVVVPVAKGAIVAVKVYGRELSKARNSDKGINELTYERNDDHASTGRILIWGCTRGA